MTTGYTMITTATAKTPATLYVTAITPRALISQGTYNAQRLLTFPGGMFTPVVYDYSPHSTSNFDIDYITQHDSINLKTQGGMATTQYRGHITDVIVTEQWEKMSLSFYRKLVNFYENQFSIPSGSYIQWQPRDKNTIKYNIVITDLHTGSRGNVSVNPAGGTGEFMLETVQFSFQIISKA